MVIIAWSAIAAFYQEHPDAKNALEYWYDVTEKADWSNINDVKETFNLMNLEMINGIQSLDDYITVMNKIEFFIQKATQNGGVETLPKEEFDTLNELSLRANVYEKNMRTGYLSQPTSISDVLKIKMIQMRLKQKDMAQLLGIAESRLSEVLSGKRKINMELAKKLNRILKMEAEFILQAA